MSTKLELPEGVPPLLTYYIYMTAGCNLACRHCWIAPQFLRNGGTGGHLDFELYKIAIEEGLPLGLSNIKYTGGEPVLHPDFVKMVDYATEKGLSSRMESNGTLITREIAQHLKSHTAMSFISVSLDGVEAATHDYMRNVPGAFERAVRGISYLVEAGYRPQVIISLFKRNVPEIEAFVKWAVDMGCGSVKFNLIQDSGRGTQLKQHEGVAVPEYIEIGNWIEKELQAQVPIPLVYSWPMAFQGLSQLNHDRANICGVFNILGILSSGHLAMCGIGTQEKDLVYGRLGEDRLADIWANSPMLQDLRASMPGKLEGVCRDCILNQICLGYCVAQNYFATGQLTAANTFCEQALEAGLFPVSRLRNLQPT
ncbi:MAG: SynChlorMet cassette radical SAM/SPASM protein ScmF [Anaerolineae bacterium]|nr:SynChlorMet cassette radical SAM/SPASM protein ScmF [Anaerolineae bacterium]